MPTFSSPIDIALFVIEILACISFATSGAITAIRKKADILGVTILTLIAVFGGGLMRDLFIQKGVPHIFWDPEYLLMAAVAIIIDIFWFVLAYSSKTARFVERHRHDFWIFLLDAIGIGVFCISGVRTAVVAMPADWNIVSKAVYLTITGVITGVGGGMFRDVFIGEIPMVFKKRFYMTPCILGTLIYVIYVLNASSANLDILFILVALAVIVGLRILAVVFQWNLPTAKGYNNLVEEQQKEQK
ncbi:MAG: TRIC cation channel family protein [Bacilli bacterium]|nr:TRIC cation channel family protein [Bacilli bacterium]